MSTSELLIQPFTQVIDGQSKLCHRTSQPVCRKGFAFVYTKLIHNLNTKFGDLKHAVLTIEKTRNTLCIGLIQN